MKSYQRLLIFLLLALAITSLLSPWVAALWNSFVDARPQWESARYSFARIFQRLFVVTGVALFLCGRSWLGIRSPRDLCLGPVRQGGRALLRGFLVAVASVAAIAVLMSLSEIYTLDFHLSLPAALKRSGATLLVALMVGVFEEIFFRGMIFKGLIEDTRPATAFAVANLFYAATHFVKAPRQFSLSGLDPLAGARYVVQSLGPLLDPAILPGLCGLFVIGLVLSYAFMRTGSLYLSIGLHAGWVFGIKSAHHYGNFSRAEMGWLFGFSEPEIVSGVATWLGIAGVGIVVHLMTQKKSVPSSGFRVPRS